MFHVVFQAMRPDMIFKISLTERKVRFWLWQGRYIQSKKVPLMCMVLCYPCPRFLYAERPSCFLLPSSYICDATNSLMPLNTTVESTNRFHAITSSLVLKCNSDRTVQEEPVHLTQVCPGQVFRKMRGAARGFKLLSINCKQPGHTSASAACVKANS